MKKLALLLLLFFIGMLSSIFGMFGLGDQVTTPPITPPQTVATIPPGSSGSGGGRSGQFNRQQYNTLADISPLFGETGTEPTVTPAQTRPITVSQPIPTLPRSIPEKFLDLFPAMPSPFSPYSTDPSAWFLFSMVLIVLLILCIMAKLISRKKIYEV